MAAYLARRMVLALFTVWAISVLTFVIIQVPEGDTADQLIDFMIAGGWQGNDSPDEAEWIREYLGLDQPYWNRYGTWIWRLLHGDMGMTFVVSGALFGAYPVNKLIGDRIWMTVALTGFTVIVTWSFAIPVGIYSAVRQHSIGDYTFTFLGFTGIAVPDFLLGLLLMYVAFAYFDQSVGGLNSAEYANKPWDLGRFYDLLKHLWIPAVVLGTSGTAGLIRIMRNNLLDELGKPYVVTARAKGVHNVKLILKYPLRLALNPLISTVGYLLPALVSGSVIVSVVLGLPTLGPILLTAVLQQDMFTAGFIILMLGILTVIGTLISDILLAVVDPRIRFTSR